MPIGVDLIEQRAAIAAMDSKLDRLAAAIAGTVENRAAVPAREFVTALDVLVDRNWPQRGRRPMVNAVSARLAWFCAEGGYPTRRTAERGTRLFHVDTVIAWRVAGGDSFLSVCRDRLIGQAALSRQPRRPAGGTGARSQRPNRPPRRSPDSPRASALSKGLIPMPEAGFRNVQDRLNRMNPTAADAALGDWLYALTSQFNTLQANYNALLAHLDTANVTGIGEANVGAYGASVVGVALPS